ncbi:LytR/AlgR family response regulator transcription factor [Pedobacter sp. UBA5917]|jgi:DNA-binding LytR/AlgR family response regulator|uniref:LytR/AlgR family response regulator transcription factor n=1 Tax=Pedobacter sp. UBA5917 TaxID=1947061 RepID=UPI0025DC477E|nr:LytTR family DNA-binding domain-containing protein [Pedobacter sp. UBA5917]
MKKINCLIIDDEKLARDILQEYVSRVDQLNLIATCADGMEAFNILQKQKIDLLFLDINMPNLGGFELLKTVANIPPVILTTAYREYALDSYQFNVIDYLLKPIPFDRFLKAITKLNKLAVLAEPVTKEESIVTPAPFIYVRSEKKMIKIPLHDLLYIEGLKDYVQLHLSDKTIITYQTLTSFEEQLSNELFLRVHRSYIVGLRHISAFTSRNIEIGKREIPVGESYVLQVGQALKSG